MLIKMFRGLKSKIDELEKEVNNFMAIKKYYMINAQTSLHVLTGLPPNDPEAIIIITVQYHLKIQNAPKDN